MRYSVVFTADTNESLLQHLIREDEQEDLCFALWVPSSGGKRMTAIIKELILPEKNERNVHGNVSFNPSYLERVIDIALKKKTGIALIHSHPFPGWQGMSKDDVNTETALSKTAYAVAGLPLIGLTVGNDGTWSARFWIKNERKHDRCWAETVRVIGSGINISFNNSLLPPPAPSEELLRTISSWGESCQSDLTRVHIGIIGLGSVGSIVAENLARLGIKEITLIDFDRIERKNRDRVLYAYKGEIGKLKVDVIGKGLRLSSTADKCIINHVPYSIIEEEGLKAALNCDVLLSCVDRPWPRYILNTIAYAHLIPVIDGGISVRVKQNGTIRGADWKAHTVGPGKQCLECSEQYTAEMVSLEMSGDLDDPLYIQGLPKEHLIHSNQNVFSFSLSLAALEMQQLLSLIIQPCGITTVGTSIYHFVDGTLENKLKLVCNSNCLKPNEIASGDWVNYKLIAKHQRAEDSRNNFKEKGGVKNGEKW